MLILKEVMGMGSGGCKMKEHPVERERERERERENSFRRDELNICSIKNVHCKLQ
jgi:hypothetical protein